MTRREALGVGAGLLVPAIAWGGQQDEVGRLPNPGMAGQPRSRTTDYENDPFIVGVEEQMRCTCGCNLDVYTCRTTDFTCQTSPAMHRQVVALVEQGKSADEILDAFIAQYGEAVLMAPPKQGFNIIGYVLPGMAITAVGAAMLWILARKTRRATVPVAGSPDGTAAGSFELSHDDAARLQRELADLE